MADIMEKSKIFKGAKVDLAKLLGIAYSTLETTLKQGLCENKIWKIWEIFKEKKKTEKDFGLLGFWGTSPTRDICTKEGAEGKDFVQVA